MDDKNLYRHYEERYRNFGFSYKTLGWGSIESQILRFEILADIADMAGKSVCDVGCGFGDLYPVLAKRFGTVRYTGIDICPTLIDEAKKQHPGVDFEVRNILENPSGEKYDYVLASGVLNYKQPDHEKYIEKMLSAMFGMCNSGIAVNFLTKYVDYENEKDFHYPPEKAFSTAMKLSRWVTLRHNYPLYEFSLFIYRDSVPPKGA